LSSDSSKVKQEKELRALLYNRACQEFGKKSEKRINYIQSYYSENPKKALYQYPENIIPECDSPMLSLDEYKGLCGQIYSMNQPKIDKFVEELY
jgi:hypothetical protein